MPQSRNYLKGLENSLKKRSEESNQFNEGAFVKVMMVVLREDAQTLQQIADNLNAYGYRTRRGNLWSAGTVHHLLKSKRVSAKELHRRMHVSSPYEQTAAEARLKRWPQKTHDAFLAAQKRLIYDNGEWVSALVYEPKRTRDRMRIRHAVHGEGQCLKTLSVSKYRCSFIDWSEENFGSFEVECTASELDVWRYHLSAEERDEAERRLKDKFYR